MTTLADRRCQSCHKDATPVDEAQSRALLEELPGWRIEVHGGERQLRKVYRFDDFDQALAFANAVGELAREENHHPALLVEWGRTQVAWWTHAIRDLHMNDFILAARTDAAAALQHRRSSD